jgi:membrane fusion protein (multidrug efflux system)
MRKFRGLIILLAVLAVLFIPKFFCGDKKMEVGPKGGGGGPKSKVAVSIQVLQAEKVSPLYQVSGTLEANEQVDLHAETQGLVTRLYFKEGAHVSKGELLLKMNDAEFQAQLKKAMATKKLKAENANRNAILLKKEAISQADYDLAVSELNAIEADIDFLKEQIRKTEIRAPFSGMIGLRNISEGTYLTPSTVIATLEDPSQLKLSFSVPEKYALKIKVNDPIHFKVSGSDEEFTAKIYARDASVSAQTRTIRMKALCANAGSKLMPGLFANISLTLGSDRNSFMIPTQSLVPVLKGQKVFIVKGDSALDVMVKTGFRSENKIEITDGLHEGDSLVVDGIMYMKKGVKVKVSKK